MGNRIAELRKKKGMSQTELGKRIGATQRQISYWENGHIDLLDAAAIADVLGCTLDELAGRKTADYAAVSLENNEKRLVDANRELDDRERAALLDMAEKLAGKQ